MSRLQYLTCSPELSFSQLSVRIALARKRLSSYPLDKLDFIMMDLERPAASTRHASQCTGDLTGRYLEFASAAEGIDGGHDPRLAELFERILRTRRPSGLFGVANGSLSNPVAPEDNISVVPYRLFPGFIQYWRATGDSRALGAAIDQGEWLLKITDRIDKWFPQGRHATEAWFTEPMAMLYFETGDERYLKLNALIADRIAPCEYAHSHGYMATMRGLQLSALYTGDKSWNEKPEICRRSIIDKFYQMADGCVGEQHPRSFRNEGCSIADWLMMNLNAGLLGRDEGFSQVENILWNAMFFNQAATGGFGHRDLTEDGYATGPFSEAWWCCTHHCGLAMTEVARHAVTETPENGLRINFLIPGEFKVKDARIKISTDYPNKARALIEAGNLKPGQKLEVRLPDCWKQPEEVRFERSGCERINLTGKIGLHLDSYDDASVLRYGPLVMAPLTYYWEDKEPEIADDIPAGYVPKFLPRGNVKLILPPADADGLLQGMERNPIPEWSYFGIGPDMPLSVEEAPCYVQCQFHTGEVRKLWFNPLCHLTSNLSYYDTPIIWRNK